jgi:hypothetical protein
VRRNASFRLRADRYRDRSKTDFFNTIAPKQILPDGRHRPRGHVLRVNRAGATWSNQAGANERQKNSRAHHSPAELDNAASRVVIERIALCL